MSLIRKTRPAILERIEEMLPAEFWTEWGGTIRGMKLRQMEAVEEILYRLGRW